MFRRIALFIVLNLIIVFTVVTILDLLNVGSYLTKYGLDLYSLAIFSLVWGIMGSCISLFLSRFLVKKMLKIKLISPNNQSSIQEANLYLMVKNLALQARLPDTPEVGIFQSNEPNAFATGPTKKRSLVAVSTGLLNNLSEREVEAVIAHEISHISNGDMVTMTLLQGVVNAFVIFCSRALAFAVTHLLGKERNGRRNTSPMTFYMFTILFELVFMILGSVLVSFVSRKREFKADKGSAELIGKAPMISALKALQRSKEKPDLANSKAIAALMINSRKHSGSSLLRLFATHPPIEERIKKLESLNLFGSS